MKVSGFDCNLGLRAQGFTLQGAGLGLIPETPETLGFFEGVFPNSGVMHGAHPYGFRGLGV